MKCTELAKHLLKIAEEVGDLDVIRYSDHDDISRVAVDLLSIENDGYSSLGCKPDPYRVQKQVAVLYHKRLQY